MPNEPQPGQTLAVTLHAPLYWQPGATAEGPEATAAALRALGTAAALAERGSTLSEEATGLELEVLRLQQKTQLLIELLALSLSRDAQRPAPTEVQLSSEGCRWAAPAVAPGTGTLAIWLHPAAPEPLRWPAEVLESRDGTVQARLLPLGDAAQMALERAVFQHHRRSVAEARAQRDEPR